MDTVEMVIPEHWLSALFNGDESGLSSEDEAGLDAFAAWMAEEYGACHAIACTAEEDDEHPGFVTWHDAREFCPYAANCSLVTFDVTSAK